MSATRKPMRMGGLMRCCIGTLVEYGGTEDEGTVLACDWCSSSMRVRDGAWEWNRDYDGHGEWPPDNHRAVPAQGDPGDETDAES